MKKFYVYMASTRAFLERGNSDPFIEKSILVAADTKDKASELAESINPGFRTVKTIYADTGEAALCGRIVIDFRMFDDMTIRKETSSFGKVDHE